MVGLPRTQQENDTVWVIIDRLTKSAHFLLIKISYSLSKLVELYIKEIIRLYEIPVSIISDRDPRFTSRLQSRLQEALGIIFKFSTAFHPQTDGQSERIIQVLEDMLRASALDFGGKWDKQVHLMEFAYNNSYQSSLDMASFKALYG